VAADTISVTLGNRFGSRGAGPSAVSRDLEESAGGVTVASLNFSLLYHLSYNEIAQRNRNFLED
jgi:CDP-diglyceride synthetase